MGSRTLSPRAAALACGALIAAGLARGAFQHLVVDGRTPRPALLDDRYRALRAALPPDERLRYLTDGPEGSPLGAQARYALAPKLLMDRGEGLVHGVADVRDPAALPEQLGRERV